ncbi:MAG TPA: hypothetical protein VL551_23155 [Actinospica sp.]|nr:hypothetical protein [Actinospica sp.]
MTDGTMEQDRDPETWLGDALRRHADAFDRVGPEPDDVIAEGRRRVRRRKVGVAGAGTGGLALAVTAGLVFIGNPTPPQVPVETGPTGSVTAAATATATATATAIYNGPSADEVISTGTLGGETWSVSASYAQAQGWCFAVAYGDTSSGLGCQTGFTSEPASDVGKPWVRTVMTGANFVQNGVRTLPCEDGVIVYLSKDVTSISMTAPQMSRVTEQPVVVLGQAFTAFVAPLDGAAFTSTGSDGKAGPAEGNVLSGMVGAGVCGTPG